MAKLWQIYQTLEKSGGSASGTLAARSGHGFS